MKNLFAACVLPLFAASAWCEPTAKAVWDSAAKTFTFYYDENTYEGDGITQYAMPTGNAWNTSPAWNVEGGPKASVTNAVFDESFAGYKPINMNSWFGGFSKLTSIVGMEYLDTSNAGYCSYMFSGCSSLTSIDLSHFDTTKMSSFREFFKNCSSIEVLDLTSFTTVTDVRSMFYGMSKLKTIYVTELFSRSGSNDNTTFSGCSALVGGAGTSYADKKVATYEYARIDGGPDSATPGYFTLGQKQVPPKIESVTASDLTHNSVTITVAGESLNDGTITVELIAGGETVKTVELSAFGDVQFAELTPVTEYSVKVTATSDYGTTTNTDCAFTTPKKPADYWLYDASEGSVSWSEWKFNATLAKDGTLQVGAVTSWPEVTMALDFSLPVKDGDGADYVISLLDPQFGFFDKNNKSAPTAYPQAAMVGLLTLPGEGLVKILQCAFMGCTVASGHLEFPSTVTEIGGGAFWNCKELEIDCGTIPGGVSKIPSYCFCGAARAYGDVTLTNVTLVEASAFQNSAITSATFGPNLTAIAGNYGRGSFQDCTSLTNVTFDASSSVRITNGYTFQGCTELEELNLCGVVDVMVNPDRNDYSHIHGCTKLKKITFGAGLTNLMCNAMANASVLEKVVFEGVPPVWLQTPYLSPYDRNGTHATGYDNKSITTYVHRDLINMPNEAGMCWADYAAEGKIEAEKTSGNTTWAAEYVYEGIDLTNRPLVTIESGIKTGIVILFK